MNKFWIVMADKPSTTITHRHATFESAKNEAFRLSQANHGDFFYVLEVIGSVGVQRMPVSWHEIDGDENQTIDPDIPSIPYVYPPDSTVAPEIKFQKVYCDGGTDDPNP